MPNRRAHGTSPGGRPCRRDGARPRTDDPAARERAKDVLHRELDRGGDAEASARAALAVSEECVEAWLVFADCAVSLDEARQRIRRAVEMATLVLGERALREGRGRLGRDPEGVDYLHALAALARVQTAEDRAVQAVQTLHGVLEMDPSDPVAVRGDLLLLLLALARDEEADELVATHPDETDVDWMYARALLRRRRATDGASLARAGEALDRAIAAFPKAAEEVVGAGPTSDSRGARGALDPLLVQAYGDTEGAFDWVAMRRAMLDAAAPAAPSTPTVAPSDPEADRRFCAEEFVEEAMEASGARREELARHALDTWPDCARAWRALASVVPPGGERARRLGEAVAAAHRAMGRDPGARPGPLPDDEAGRLALAMREAWIEALREDGRPDAADAQEARLSIEDPDDTTRVAVRRAVRLLCTGRDAEAAPLIEAHVEDASPDWSWLAVLLRRRAGDRVGSAFALGEAMLCAPLVGEFLRFGRTPPRGEDRDYDASWREAVEVSTRLRPAFEASPEALAWLRAQQRGPGKPSRERPGRPPG